MIIKENYAYFFGALFLLHGSFSLYAMQVKNSNVILGVDIVKQYLTEKNLDNETLCKELRAVKEKIEKAKESDRVDIFNGCLVRAMKQRSNWKKPLQGILALGSIDINNELVKKSLDEVVNFIKIVDGEPSKESGAEPLLINSLSLVINEPKILNFYNEQQKKELAQAVVLMGKWNQSMSAFFKNYHYFNHEMFDFAKKYNPRFCRIILAGMQQDLNDLAKSFSQVLTVNNEK